MIGVNFQPGSQDYGQQNGNGRPSGGSGVQEAIKILSLRLPRVMGAQGATPMPLLTSQGSGGNPRVDSVVNQVLSRVMPGQPPPLPMQPSRVGGGPSFAGTQNFLPNHEAPPWAPPGGFAPRVIIGGPLPPTHPRSGQPLSQPDTPFPTGMFGTLPSDFHAPAPHVPNFDEPIFRKPHLDYQGGGADAPSFGEPLF